MKLARILLISLALAWPAKAQSPRWHLLPTPTQLGQRVLAHDEARGRLVLIECGERAGVSRTWERLHGNWSLRRTSTTPPPRQGFAAAYDPMRRKLVLFGGCTAYYYHYVPGALLADTWEYDGIDWVQRTPSTSPPPQVGGVLCHDPGGQGLLMVGGQAAVGLPGTWRYDGAAWAQQPWAPFAGHLASLAADRARGNLVALVNQGGNAASAETWLWDGSTWSQAQPPQSPPPRRYAAAAFDPRLGGVVVYGGFDNGHAMLDDMWLWQGATWSSLGSTNVALGGHALGYDAARGRLVSLGGGADATTGATRSLQGSNWQTDAVHLRTPWLPPLDFDPLRGTLVTTTGQETLEWDGSTWRALSAPAGMFKSRGVAFDPTRGVLVATGIDANHSSMVWERHGATWGAAIPTPNVTGIGIGNPVWHAGLAAIVALAPQGLVRWNGTQWTVLDVNPAQVLQCVYDPARDEIVALGRNAPVRLTYLWGATGWRVDAATVAPPFGSSLDALPDALGYDQGRQRVVLFGGRNPVTGSSTANFHQFYDDLWEWDGSAWALRPLPGTPRPRELARFAYDPVRQQLLLFGGARQEHNGAHLAFGDVHAILAASAAQVNNLSGGCSGPFPLRLVAGEPHPGAAAFALDLIGAPADVPAVFLLGAAGVARPLPGGCTSFVPGLDFVAFAVTDRTGSASLAATIPLEVAGYSCHAQAAALDATAPLGISLSPGLAITVGY